MLASGPLLMPRLDHSRPRTHPAKKPGPEAQPGSQGLTRVAEPRKSGDTSCPQGLAKASPAWAPLAPSVSLLLVPAWTPAHLLCSAGPPREARCGPNSIDRPPISHQLWNIDREEPSTGPAKCSVGHPRSSRAAKLVPPGDSTMETLDQHPLHAVRAILPPLICGAGPDSSSYLIVPGLEQSQGCPRLYESVALVNLPQLHEAPPVAARSTPQRRVCLPADLSRAYGAVEPCG